MSQKVKQPARAAAAAADQELMIYDEIAAGFWGGISARDVVERLRGMSAGGVLNVRIHSRGGDVFEGVAIYNALRNHAAKNGTRIVTHIDGLAASIASVVALAGDEVRMAPNALLMVHNAWSITWGDAECHRKAADDLEKITAGAIASTYEARTGASSQQVKEWMDAETWFTAAEAKDAGFVDAVEERVDPATQARVQARVFDLSQFQRAPEPLRAAAAALPDVRNAERRLREAGFSRAAAKAGASAAYRALAGQRDAGRESSDLTIDRHTPAAKPKELPMSDEPTNPAPKRLTRAQLDTDYAPEVGAIRAEAGEAAVKAERDRTRAINALAKPGREKVIADAIADGKSTAGDVALLLEAASAAKGKQHLKAQEEDEKNLDAPKPDAEPTDESTPAAKATALMGLYEQVKGPNPKATKDNGRAAA